MFLTKLGLHRAVNNNRLFSTRKPSVLTFRRKKKRGQKLTMITAYDYFSAMYASKVGFDMILVGDSVGMTMLGYDTTQHVTMMDMVHHCKATRRGAPNSFIVADLPFGSFEASTEWAFENSFALIKDGGADAIKIEGGCEDRIKTIASLTNAGIPVMGHIGLTPQSVGTIGGFISQGRSAKKGNDLVKMAQQLEKRGGVFGMVVECVPEVVTEKITNSVNVPTIGIGAGPSSDGQVLVHHDVLGYGDGGPGFCKPYENIGKKIEEALQKFKDDVETSAFPIDSPYGMCDNEKAIFTGIEATNLLREDKKKERRTPLNTPLNTPHDTLIDSNYPISMNM
jgi:3-methyl-2-oxobutanoate hydroxymethyltransferase